MDLIFFKAQEEAIKYLRGVRLEEIEVDNNLGVTKTSTSTRYYQGAPDENFEKTTININDLLKYSDVDKTLKEEFQQ